MLSAILHGKARHLASGVEPGQLWRHVFRSSEDLLTATVFERLAYLDAALFWRVLQRAAKPELLPRRATATLEQMDLWPRWPLSMANEDRLVEPDVFLSFSIGDPARRFDLIVEAKLGESHSAQQWVREWCAYQQTYGGDTDHDVVLVAIGGPENNVGRLVELTDAANQELASNGLTLLLHAASLRWPDMVAAVAGLLVDGPDARTQRVVDDIIEALALHGYRHVPPLRDLAAAARLFLGLSERSHDALALRLAPRVTATSAASRSRPDSISSWLAAAGRFRPITSTRLPSMRKT